MNLYAYCNNDPINHYDPTGNLTLDVIIDCYFAAKSLTEFFEDRTLENLGWAALDLLCLFIPLVTGAGTIISKVDDIKDISSFISKHDEVIVLGQSMNSRIIPYANTIGASYYGGLDDFYFLKTKYGKYISSAIGYVDNMLYILFHSFGGAQFIDYGFDPTRSLHKAYAEGKAFEEIMSIITIYSEQFFARMFRHKNVFRFWMRFLQ